MTGHGEKGRLIKKLIFARRNLRTSPYLGALNFIGINPEVLSEIFLKSTTHFVNLPENANDIVPTHDNRIII